MSDIISSAANTINYRYTSNLGWFQFGGISSGLDTSSIIEKILEIESRPLQNLNLKYEKLKLQREVWNDIDAKLEEFRDLIFDLKLKSNLYLMSASSSDESILSVSASPSAIEGTYYVKVVSLAKSSVLSGAGIMNSSLVDSSTSYGSIDFYTTPEDSVIRIYNAQTGDYVDVNISTSDTVGDIENNITKALQTDLGLSSASAQYDSSSGKFVIDTGDPDETITITQLSGNFMEVFHLDEVTPTGSRIESSAPVWTVSEDKTLDYIASKLSKSISDGTITINGAEISISTSDTIAQVVSKITSATDAGVTAYYDYHQNQIVLVSRELGNNPIVVEDPDSTGIPALLGLMSNENGNPIFSAGQGSHIQISLDGNNYTDVYSDSNTVTYKGITFDVKNTTSTPVIVRVSKDVSGIEDKIQEFVDKWNEVMEFLYEKLNEEPVEGKSWDEMSDEEKKQGILRNDPSLRSLFERIKNFMIDSFNSSGEIHHLFEIGVSSGDIGSGFENMLKGHLEIDETKLEEAINQNMDEVWNFLAGADDSFFESLHSFLWDVTKFAGEIDNIAGTDGRIDREQKYLAEQIADWVRRLQKREEELWRKFSYMEEVLARFQAQSAWLAQFTANQNK